MYNAGLLIVSNIEENILSDSEFYFCCVNWVILLFKGARSYCFTLFAL